MKKSVRIRKAGPNEKPGYYNKTAKFLQKAQNGLQVNNNLLSKLKVIMLDTETAVRDGADPQEVFRKLLMDYGMPQEIAYKIMQTVMAKLADNGYTDPKPFMDDETDQQLKQEDQSQNSNTFTQNQNVETSNEDEELALAQSEEDSGYDAMDHYNNRDVEQDEEQTAFGRYGGSFDNGGEYQNYLDSESSPEEDIINQYSNPGQLNMEQKIPMTIEEMLRSFNLPNNQIETPDLNAYLQGIYNYSNISDDNISDDFLPTSQEMYGDEYAKGGISGSDGPGRKGRKGRAKKNKQTIENTSSAPHQEITPTPGIRIEPQESVSEKPGILQRLQNAYFTKNMLAPERNVFGKTAQVIGTGLNYVRPRNWTESGTMFGLVPGREQTSPATTATKTYEDVYNILTNKEYKPETLIPNEDGTFSSGLAFNMGPELHDFITSSIKEKNVKDALEKQGTFQFEFPTSSVPELNFLSLHNEKNNTKIKLVKDKDGKLKVELFTDVKTPLKGLEKNSLRVKDEFFIDPQTQNLIDVKTGMPLEQIQKSYYKGNELNWYNRPGTIPFTPKYPGLELESYPQKISSEPLKQTPPSRWSVFNNLVTKPLFGTPYVLPLTYPGFAAKSKFYPKSNKVTVDYFGRARDLGPQAPGGMTFGDQPFGAQYADYNLQANKNYLTGRNFMIGAGLLGAGLGGGYLYYNRNTNDWEIGSEKQPFLNSLIDNYTGKGYSFDKNRWGIDLPKYQKDSMYVSPNGDTIHDKGWGVPAEDYKKGGAHKKKFLKIMQQIFEPGGEAQDPSLGKGSRMDNLNSDVAKKKSWIGALKKQSDKAANEELYDLVQKSGDPKLMNIFMGDNQEEQPQNNQMIEQPQFGEMGGYVNMNATDPLTRFVYGGNEPDYYEQDNLPEARDGVETPPIMKYDEWFKDYTNQDNWPGAFAGNEPGDNALSTDPNEATAYNKWLQEFTNQSPEAEGKRFDAYQNYLNFRNEDEEDEESGVGNLGYEVPVSGSNNITTHNCPPGSVWVEKYQQCVPIMQIKYNPRIVAGDPGLHNIFLPWNPIFKTKANPLGKPYASLEYRKHLLSPKRTLNIWNPDGKLSKADMKVLMDYGLGYKQKEAKSKDNKSVEKRINNKNKQLNNREQLEADYRKRYDVSNEEWNSTDKKGKRIARQAEKYEQGKGARYKTDQAYEKFKDSSFNQQMINTGKWYADKAKKIVKPFIKKK